MKRLFVKPDQILNGVARLDRDQRHRLVKVLRMKNGDRVVLFDGNDRHLAEVSKNDAGKIELVVTKKLKPEVPRVLDICLAQALIKAPRMDMVVEKATELGVSRIVPVVTERSVPKGNMTGRIGRWNRIAQSASAQCGRVDVPEIGAIRSFDEAILIDADLKTMLWEDELEAGAEKIIADGDGDKKKRAINSIALLTGPEGGFTDEEVEKAVDGRWITWGLGALTLRAETASIAGISILTHSLAGRFR